MKNIQSYHAIGLMSGSSLDGLDICYVKFLVEAKIKQDYNSYRFSYEVVKTDYVEYPEAFRALLRNAPNVSAFEFAQLHTNLGNYFGKQTHEFILKNGIETIDFIASHGQTIFHQPQSGFTTQIGCGAQIAAQTNRKVVCDFRTTDIARGGQGAPLVPIAEKYLFPKFNAFLNLGGIANISFHTPEVVVAFDICAANTLLNFLANNEGLPYDKGGALASTGKINEALLQELNAIDFCSNNNHKSLGTEHVYSNWIAIMNKYDDSNKDKLAAAVEHIAIQVGKAISSNKAISKASLMITGGGALNSYLIERIKAHCSLEVVVPDVLTVNYKEALAIAFLGLCRILEIPNSLSSVTGAKKDSIGGAVYLP